MIGSVLFHFQSGPYIFWIFAICAFVSSDVGTETIDVLSACRVKLILMRCAGFNNVDVEKATA